MPAQHTRPLACRPSLATLACVALLAPAIQAETKILPALADAHIDAGSPDLLLGREPILLVKAINDPKTPSAAGRKAYFKFSLEGVDKSRIQSARLQLSPDKGFFKQGNVGFLLHGITDRAVSGDGMLGEDWSEDTITWKNAPANNPDSGHQVFSKPGSAPVLAINLGSSVSTAQSAPQVLFGGEKLLAFLKADTNRQVSFIVTRNAPLGSGVNTPFVAREGAANRPDAAPLLILELSPAP